MDENKLEGFTLKLALVDLIPVILFAGGAGLLNKRLGSVIFAIGIFCCLLGGVGKVTWKIIIAFTKKDIQFLFKQMRVMMPGGFLLMLIGIIVKWNNISWMNVLNAVISFPSILFFVIGIIGIVIMSIFAKKLDPNDLKSNWIEQCTNIVAQGGFFLGILFGVM